MPWRSVGPQSRLRYSNKYPTFRGSSLSAKVSHRVPGVVYKALKWRHHKAWFKIVFFSSKKVNVFQELRAPSLSGIVCWQWVQTFTGQLAACLATWISYSYFTIVDQFKFEWIGRVHKPQWRGSFDPLKHIGCFRGLLNQTLQGREDLPAPKGMPYKWHFRKFGMALGTLQSDLVWC